MPKTKTGKAPLSAALRERLKEHVRQHGEQKVAAAMNVQPSTLARAVAGFALQPGTVALITAKLAGVVAS